MVATTAVRNLIREGKLHQIPGIMQASQKDGMQTMDMALVELATRGLVTKSEAQSRSMKFNETEIAGFPDGNAYETREDAEAAALTKAKSLIDESALSKNPLKSGL